MKKLLVERVHTLSNILQLVISYLEVGRNHDALREVHAAITELRQLRKLIASIDPEQQEKSA